MHAALKLILTAACLSAAIPASAQMRLGADMDEDGAISQTEFMTRSNTRFARIDANQDGLLSQEEREAAHEVFKAEREAKKFAKIDSNGDGFISREEFAAKSQRRPQRADRRGADDRDQSQRPRRHRTGEHRDRKGGHWARVDTNNDGFISRAEYDAGAEAMFKRMDRNNDGVVNQNDRPDRNR